MDVYSVDLASTGKFQSWYLAQREAGVPAVAMIEALETLESELASIRALNIAYWNRLSEHENRFIQRCLNSSNPLAPEIAKGYAVYRRSITVLQHQKENRKARLAELKPALDLSLKTLTRLPPSELRREAEIGLLFPLCLMALEAGHIEEGTQHASEALFWAEQMNAPVSVARARNMLVGCKAYAGKFSDIIGAVSEERQQGFRYDPLYTEIVMAEALYRLGNYDQATATLRALEQQYDGEGRLRASGYLQRMTAFWGAGGMEGTVYPTPRGSSPCEWIVEALRALMTATGLPKDSRSAPERSAAFRSAIAVCRSVQEFPLPWTRLLCYWVMIAAHIGLGEFVEAETVFELTGKPEAEWLDIEVLLAGAGLELSLTFPLYELSTPRAEERLRAVFARINQTPYGSAEGLAQLLRRWHPSAAAYLALMPESIAECAAAVDGVLRTGAVNKVYDLNLPPVFACELLLRSLDFDQRARFNFVQSDPGASRDRRKMLVSKYGDVALWRMPISPIKLVFGLMKQQGDRYSARAQSIIAEFGCVPQTKANYLMRGAVEEIDRLTRRLLSGHITPKGFAEDMLQLRG